MTKFNFAGKIKSIEIIDERRCAIITKQGRLITENYEFELGNYFLFPMIRRIDEETILVVDSHGEEKKKNARIYNSKGEVLEEFHAGDGINDIIVFDRKFIFTYFDEGVFSENKISNEGLTIFNKKGKFLWGFNSNTAYQIYDCYQIVKSGMNHVLFFGYGKFPVLELDINMKTLKEMDIPVEYYADSFSKKGMMLYWKKSIRIYAYNMLEKELKIIKKLKKNDNSFLIEDQLVLITKDGYEMNQLNM